MSELTAGVSTSLKVKSIQEYGYFLTDGIEAILLHRSEATNDLEIGDEVEVFLYKDKQERLAATMTIPGVANGTYDWVEVIEVKDDLGAFVNIGIQKDILISMDDLPAIKSLWPREGDKLYITLKNDKHGRLLGRLATENIFQDIAKKAPFFMQNQDIKGFVYRLLKVGSFIITDEGYRCFLHESEREQEPRLGELISGRVIGVKEDGSLNISLFPRKQDKMLGDAERIYNYLESRDGAMPYWDKSYPEDIEARFGISKGAFKRALGKLIKDNKVYQEDGWTYIKAGK